MTIVFALSPLSLTQFFYNSGTLVRPARLFFYKPNTEDRVTVYTDPTLGIPYDQPVLSGGSGRVPPIYVGTEPYRVRVFDSNGSLIEDIDYLPGAIAAGGTGEPGDPLADGVVLQTGDMFLAVANATTTRLGCVRANGRLIGPPGFDASPYPGQIERLSTDTHDLFVWLWGQDHALVSAFPVAGGRGDTAESDWALNKAIYLPDLRGRAPVGLDGMGNALSHRLDGTSAATDWSGKGGGAAFTTQTIPQMPLHDHWTWTANQNAAISIIAAGTGIIQTPHTHTYTNAFIPDRAVSVSLGRGDADEVMVMSGAPGATPLSVGVDDTGGANANLGDPGHVHPLSQTPHVHQIPIQGNNEPMQTISPFCTAVVYIKL